MLRRTLLSRTTLLASLGSVACLSASSPARDERRLIVLAPTRAGREARTSAWNRRYGEPEGTLLELTPLPDAGTPRPEAAGPDALSMALAANPSAGQLVWLEHTDVPALALQRRLRALGDLVRRDRYDLKRFMPPALQPAYGLDERLYVLPEEVESRQVYFNRDHFEDADVDFRTAGFDFERPALTWEALRRTGLDLLAGPRGRARLPFHPGHHGAPLELWGWQNGGEWLAPGGRRATFTRPEHVAALTWLVAHAQEVGGPERLAAAGPFPAPARTGDAADGPERHPFLMSQVSVCAESTRFVSTVAGWRPDFPLRYVEPPRRAHGAPLVSWSRAWGYALLAGAPDGAWAALRFLVDADAALVDAAATASQAPPAGTPGSGASGSAPLAGRPLWFPPYSGQIAVDRWLAQRFRTGSKLLDEGHDHGWEQLRHARFRPLCPAPRSIWPLLEEARRVALLGVAPPAEALAVAQAEAQARLDAAWHLARA